jgi:hypothetical protein
MGPHFFSWESFFWLHSIDSIRGVDVRMQTKWLVSNLETRAAATRLSWFKIPIYGLQVVAVQ